MSGGERVVSRSGRGGSILRPVFRVDKSSCSMWFSGIGPVFPVLAHSWVLCTSTHTQESSWFWHCAIRYAFELVMLCPRLHFGACLVYACVLVYETKILHYFPEEVNRSAGQGYRNVKRKACYRRISDMMFWFEGSVWPTSPSIATQERPYHVNP